MRKTLIREILQLVMTGERGQTDIQQMVVGGPTGWMNHYRHCDKMGGRGVSNTDIVTRAHLKYTRYEYCFLTTEEIG